MRQVRIGEKWVNGTPTEAGQRFRFSDVDGWSYGTYQPDVVSGTRITKQKFKLRLAQAERIAIREAAKANATVFDFQDLLDSGSHVDLSDSVLIAGLAAMEQFGLIAAGRAQEILSAPITETERYEG
jgi:hypothetical protein